MSRRKNNTKKPRRERLSVSTYRTARQLAVLFNDPNTPIETTQTLSEWLFEMAKEAGIGIDHPTLISLVFLEACRVLTDRLDREGEGAIRSPGNRARLKLYYAVQGIAAINEEARNGEGETPETDADDDPNITELARLVRQLSDLERLPENEATRFQLETEIARLKRLVIDDEWPELIDA